MPGLSGSICWVCPHSSDGEESAPAQAHGFLTESRSLYPIQLAHNACDYADAVFHDLPVSIVELPDC